MTRRAAAVGALVLLGTTMAHAEPGRRGLVDDEPIYKWSAPTLDAGDWVVGLGTVAHGVDDDVTLATHATSVLLGHYNVRARVAVADGERTAVSIDGGVGLVTSLALAGLFVPDWEGRPALAVLDLGVPVTLRGRPGRFGTIEPWIAVAAGRVDEGDRGLTGLLARPSLTGGGVSGRLEVHLSRRVAVAAWQDLGLDAFGGVPRVGSRTGGALVLATGPLRVNLGAAADVRISAVDGTTGVVPVPAIDLWARF